MVLNKEFDFTFVITFHWNVQNSTNKDANFLAWDINIVVCKLYIPVTKLIILQNIVGN